MWVNTTILKYFKLFEINPRQDFNIESMCDNHRFKDLKLIYSYKKVEASNYNWDSKLTLNGTYPNYRFDVNQEILNTSIIYVLAYEGDKERLFEPQQSSNSWRTITTIKRINSFKLTNANNHTIDLDRDLGGEKWNKEKITLLPLLDTINMTEYDKGYDLTMVNLGGVTYQCNVKSIMYSGKKITQEYTYSQNNIPLREDCIFATITGVAYAELKNDSNLKIYKNDQIIGERWVDSNAFNPCVYLSKRVYKDVNEQTTVGFSGDGKDIGFQLIQHLWDSQPTHMKDYEVTLLIIERG